MRVLLVEDDPPQARVIARGLVKAAEPAEARVSVVHTLADALAAEGEFDIALVDPGLPDASGLDALLAWLDAGKTAPVVILSGSLDDGLLEAVIAAGAEDAIEKCELSSRALWRRLQAAVARQRRLSVQRMTEAVCSSCRDLLRTVSALQKVQRHAVVAGYEIGGARNGALL